MSVILIRPAPALFRGGGASLRGDLVKHKNLINFESPFIFYEKTLYTAPESNFRAVLPRIFLNK